MRQPAVNHGKAQTPRQWRCWAPRPCTGGRDRAARGAHRPRGPVCRLAGRSLNWSLRRYVRASSLRVWLRRRQAETRCAPCPAATRAPTARAGAVGRDGLRRAGRHPGPAGQGRPGGPPDGRTRPSGTRRRHPKYRNGQMEHFTQAAMVRRGRARPGPAGSSAEREGARDLGLATLRDRATMQGDIFRFVMT
jgi:hypothetical protein